MRKRLSFVFLSIILLILVMAILGYGSRYIGPKDLGIVADQQDFNNALKKLDLKTNPIDSNIPPADSLYFNGTHPIIQKLTEEELTAFIRYFNYAYNPLKDDFQLRLNNDNTFDISGTLIINNIIPSCQAFDVPKDDIRYIMSALRFIKTDAPFLMSGEISITDNKPSISVHHLKVAHVPIPLGPLQDTIEQFTQDRINSITGLNIKNLNIDDGKAELEGMSPDSVSYVQG